MHKKFITVQLSEEPLSRAGLNLPYYIVGMFILVILLFLSSHDILAQEDTKRLKAINDELDKLAVLQYQTKQTQSMKLAAKRERVMDETMNKILRKKESKQALFYNATRIGSLPKEIKNGNGTPRSFSIKNTRNALIFSSESEIEDRKIASSSSVTHRSRLLFEESLQTDFKGSVYHPNLAAFDINLENGLRQNREKFQPNLTGKLKNSPLNYFHTLFSFLRQKPYAFSLFADKSREVQNREFFEREVINSDRYGGNFGFKNKFIPIGLSFNNSVKTIERVTRPSQNFRDDEVSLNLSNESNLTGQTFFDAVQDKFSRTEEDVSDQKGTSRDFNLSNQKFLSADEKKLLYSSLHYYDLSGTSKSKVLNLNENLNLKHTDYLDSSYTYNFSDKVSSGVTTRDNRVSGSLRHRLYESLTSSFSPYYFKSNASTFSQDSYGASLDENYVKKLGRIGKLSSGVGFTYSEEKRKEAANIISIIDESHTLSIGAVTFLDRLRVDTATVVVTNVTQTTTYILNIDYQLISAGERTQIQRIPGGGISNGDTVLVDYQAKSTPSLQFNTLNDNFRFRIDFLDELIGVYYRFAKESHPKISTGQEVILQSLNDTIIGTDFHYKNLSAEIEHENYDSNLSPYKQLRIRESFFINPTEKSTLTFQSSQIIVRLINLQDTQRFIEFISRYSIALNGYSRYTIEAGYRWQKGTGIGLDDITAGSLYELNLGQLLMNIRYDLRRQLYLGDKWLNHFFSVLIKRVF